MVNVFTPADAGSQGLHGFSLGERFNGITPGGGTLARLMVFNKDVTGADYTNICTYLTRKYALFQTPPAVPSLLVNGPSTFNGRIAPLGGGGVVDGGVANFTAGLATVNSIWANSTNAITVTIMNSTNSLQFASVSNVVANASFQAVANNLTATNRFGWMIFKP